MPDTVYPTITNEPPPEDTEDLLTVPQEDFSAPVNPQDIEEAHPYTSAPINPQDIRVQQRRDFLAQPVMSDVEAGQTYQRLPFMEDAERKGALAKLDRYTADLDERDDRFHANERAYEFTNPNARATWLDQPEVRNNLGYLEDSNAAFDRMAVKKFLETNVLKRPLNSDAEYEAERNNFVGRIMTGKPKVSDTEAFQTIKASVEREQKLNVITAEAAGLMLQKYVQGAISGTDVQVGDVYNEVSKKNAELVQGYEGQLYQGLQAVKLDFDATLGRNREAIGVFANFIQKDMAGIATPEDQAAAQQAFLSVDKKDRANVMGLLEKGLAAGDKESEWFRRGWHDLVKAVLDPLGVTTLAKQQMSVGRDWEYTEALDKLKAGKEGRMGLSGEIVFPTPEELKKFPDAYRKLTKEETTAAIKNFETLSEFNDINRQFTGVKESTYNKYQGMFPKDFLWGLPKAVELGAYGFQEQIAPMAFAMTGGQVGKLLYTTAVAPAYYEDWMRESPTANKTVAMTGSILSAYAESWLEGFQGLSAVGESVFKKYLLTLRNGGAKAFLKLTLGGFAEQMIEESTQNATTILIGRMTQDIALAIDPNVDPGKVQNAAEMLQDWKNQIGPTAAMMIWPAITGAGIGTYRHLKDPVRQEFNPDTLRRWGIAPAKINQILGEPDWDKRQALLEEATAARTKADIADGITYSAEQDQKAQQDEQTKADQGHPQVTLDAVTTPDGERRFNVIDPEGEVVRENLPAEEALNEVASLQEQVDREILAQQAEQAVSEEAVARNVQAEAVWEQLKPEDKTTAANIVEFSYAKPTTPEDQRRLATIQSVVAERNKQFGRDDKVVLASADVPTTRAGVGAANFISWFETTFGKRVQFVASESGEPLSFTGFVAKADPNTIFLDVAGDRNILSLVGHEWSHTLETTNPKLWADIVSQIKPLVVDWAKALGRIDESYSADQATPEFVANVVGDAFGDPEFWARVRQKDPSLFARLVAAIKEWFDTITDRVSEYGTQAPDVIKDWEGIRNIVAAAMERAQEGTEAPMTDEEVNAALQEAAAASPSLRHRIQASNRRTEKGFYSKLEGVVVEKIPKSASPEQVKATINGAGIKAEEIKWSGVMPTIDRLAAENAGKVPKEKLQAHLEDEGAVKFKEEVIGVEAGLKELEAASEKNHRRILELNDQIAAATDHQITVRDLVQGRNSVSELAPTTRQLWDERIALAKETERLDEEFARNRREPKYASYVLPGGKNYREVVLAMPTTRVGKVYDVQAGKWIGASEYTSNHFPNVPNYVAHMRLNEREGGLFLEEIQSDRHQQGREEGYDVPLTREDYDAGIRFRKPGGIPDAPFRKDWPLAMFKRALRDAVATGKSWIGWTIGETQAERYDLSKQVDAVRLSGDFDQGIEVSVARQGQDFEHLQTTTKDKLADVVGKDIAKKALEEGQTEFRGLDLKVGGEGMKGFYDRMLPSEIGKYVKQWGGKVEQGGIAKAADKPFTVVRRDDGMVVADYTNIEAANMTRRQLGEEAFVIKSRPAEETPIWKVEITPQMHKGVTEGQAQFSGRREEAEPAALPIPTRAGGPVTITAFDPALMQFKEREVVPSRELLHQLKEEARIYDQLLRCLS